MKSRVLLTGLVAAAIAVAAVLILWPRSTGHEESPPAAGRAPEAAGGRSARGEGGGKPIDRDGEDAVGRAGPDGPRGATADHRGETPSFPRRHRPGDKLEYVVQAPVIAGLRRALQPEIKRCSDEHGQGLPAGARIQSALEVTVRSGVLSVLNAKVEQSGGPESSPLVDCVRRAFAAAEVRAPGHPDVERHVLRFPFQVPVP